MAITGDSFDMVDNFTNAFKRVFKDDKANQDLYNFRRPLLEKIKVTDGFVGTDEERVRATGPMGGYGFGSLPRNNESNLIRPRLEAEKFYVTALLDTESMAAAMTNEGAFFDLVDRVKLEIRRAQEFGLSLALTKTNVSKELVLGVVASTSGSVTGSNPYVCTLTSLHKHNFHVKQIVTVQDANTDEFEVTAIDDSAGTVTLNRVSGSQVPASGDEIMLQGSDGAAMMGLPGAVAQSGTLYNVAIGAANNWIARVNDTSGAAIAYNTLFDEVIEIMDKTMETPDLIVCSKVQFKKLAAVLDGKRSLNDMSDAMGHSTLSLAGPEGPIPIIWDQLIEDEKIYVLNTKHIELRKRALSGIVEAGGEMLIPMYPTGADQYLLVYRCYGNFYIEPSYHGLIDNLAV